ncbi:MAG: ABC transporter ATP-binding protein [Acidimicrobiales bacterium]
MSDAAAGLLEVRNLTIYHGQLCAVDDISFSLATSEVLAIIGANGAGKSTLLRTIAGLHVPTSGTITYLGEDVSKLRTHQRVRRGISLVPEGRRLFASLTLEENIQVGAQKAADGPFNIAAVYELFAWMPERRHQKVGQLSGGEQQSVAIARALVANPKVLMIDEVSLGLAPIVIERIYEFLPRIVAEGIGVLLVEQDVSQALAVATRVHCLLEGKTSLVGAPGDLSSAAIESAYFGTSHGTSLGSSPKEST